jgi:uncharacterized protein (DUF427 family)
MLATMRPQPTPPGPGQESVWDYPRPPRLEPVPQHLEVVLGGVSVAATDRGLRVLETSHPPVYYFPPGDVDMAYLRAVSGSSFCEWKGVARYFDVVMGGSTLPRVAWAYPEPTSPFSALVDHVAFYCAPMDRCQVGDEVASPQPGGFYGGWVTSWVVGPFKGEPGTLGW